MRPVPLAFAALFLIVTSHAHAEDPAKLHLDGVKAEVRAPAGTWTREVKNLAAGQWRAAFRGTKAQCEARTFPVQSVEDPVKALWQAADVTSRQVKGDAFGLTSVRALRLEGRDAADSDFWVQVGTTHWEGTVRLLRAAPDLWALAWGLATPDASKEEQRAAAGFAGSLVPSEPGFYEPSFSDGDPEEVLAQPHGEPAVVRRHAVAVLALLEAGAGVRFPRPARTKVLGGLAREAREGGAKTREGLRASADAFAESAGLAPEPRAATRQAIGRRIVEALFQRADGGHFPAQELSLTITHGRALVAGTAEDGLTRFEADLWIDGCAFFAALAGDAAFEPSLEQRETQRTGLAGRWEAWKPQERVAAKAAASAAADLAAAWTQADVIRRLTLRGETTGLLLPPVPLLPSTPSPGLPRVLRARIDGAQRDPAAIFAKACALAPAEHLRLHAVLSPQAPR